MSRKNHKVIDGKLLQTDKKFATLKGTQQEKICNWLLEEYLKIATTENRLLTKVEKEATLDLAYEKIEAAGIWIPYQEVERYLSGKLQGWNKKYLNS